MGKMSKCCAHGARRGVCDRDMLMLVRWHVRKLAVPLAQLTAIDPDDSTEEALGGWHYWIA